MHVGVRELKNHLSEYLARVAAGDDVVVTDRGRPVARLTGVGTEQVLARLVDEGVVSPATAAKQPAPGKRVVADGTVSDLVVDQRR